MQWSDERISERQPGTSVDPGGVDCDVHVEVPSVGVLLPYLTDYWRDLMVIRGIDRLDLSLTSYPKNAPLSCRPDWRLTPEQGVRNVEVMQHQLLDHFKPDIAILNCLHAAYVFHAGDMAAALCRAINDWLADAWLDRDPRLRASMLVPWQEPELAVEEIERRSADPRFVQVLLLVMGETPLGRRSYWPVYQAAARHGLPIGIHAGSSYRHAPAAIGWPSYYLEDYVLQTQAFESQLLSLVAEGVFAKFPDLKVVLLESGFAWLPAFLWRADKTWRGVRAEIPWVATAPSAIVREHVRMTIQPVDEPPDSTQLERVLEQIGSEDMLLFSSDYPHWQFDGDEVMPQGFPARLRHRLQFENPFETYPRLAARGRQAERRG